MSVEATPTTVATPATPNKEDEKSQNEKEVTKIPNKKKSRRKKKNSNAWNKPKKASSLDAIMNEQSHSSDPFFMYGGGMDDNALIEQQMILEAIAESQKMAKKFQDEEDEKAGALIQKNEPIPNSQKATTTKTDKINDELLAQSIQAQSKAAAVTSTQKSDQKLAQLLQQQEQQELHRRRKLQTMYNGKYAKVTSVIAAENIPTDALSFYYDDDSMMHGADGMTKQQFAKEQQNSPSSSSKKEEAMSDTASSYSNSPNKYDKDRVTKHNADVWSKRHFERLNEYETGGNLDGIDGSMHISNKAFNSFRNQLDKKGFVDYTNYSLEPKQSKHKHYR